MFKSVTVGDDQQRPKMGVSLLSSYFDSTLGGTHGSKLYCPDKSMTIQELLYAGDVKGLTARLNNNPELASAPIPLKNNPAVALPLHRVCDGVACGYFQEETGVMLAQALIDAGADLNAITLSGNDSPLTAACSLGCDKLAILYIDQGAIIHHRGASGGTALHWASWCGRDVVVRKLLTMNVEINQRCTEYQATPLFWAIHGYRHGEKYHQAACAKMLLDHGADPSIPNKNGHRPVDLLTADDTELWTLFSSRT